MAAATATAAASAAGLRGEGLRRATRDRRTEDRKLNGGAFAGALGAGDFLLLVDYDFLEFIFAVIANVFVNGHALLRLGAAPLGYAFLV